MTDRQNNQDNRSNRNNENIGIPKRRERLKDISNLPSVQKVIYNNYRATIILNVMNLLLLVAIYVKVAY